MDNQTHNAIVAFIWGIADDCLRDVYVRGKYRDVILPMTVIRRLDVLLEPTKQAVLDLKAKLDAAHVDNQWGPLSLASGQAFCNVSPFLLRDLTSRAKRQTLKADFEAYLDGFSPNVQEILEKFKFRNQIGTMVEADILGAVIEKFTSRDINLSPNPVYKDEEKTVLEHPGLDNHGMGTIFEELIRRFNEENNEEAGEHWTPRDVVELMADLIFIPVAGQIKDATYTCYDGACGTGGMLTVAQERLTTLAGQHGKNKVSIHLFGQEVNPETYAIAKADLLLKGDGEQAEHITYGSTLSLDGNPTRQFDFMLSNPPYGKSWKTDAEKMGGKKEILDTRFNVWLEGGEHLVMIPRTSDGQLLFLLNNVSKMKKDTPLGSRIAEVHNGSSIFTGDAGSGESNARRYMIENDLVEAIIAVPENMFYNTGIGTFIWILSNRKEERRRGKIQLIDATAMKSPLRRNMGNKNCEFTAGSREGIVRIFLEMEESEVSKVLNNEDFAYWSVTVERPLRLRVYPDRAIPASTFRKPEELEAVKKVLAAVPETTPLDDWGRFAAATGLKPAALKKIRPFITETDPAAQPVEGEADVALRDTEIVPFTYEGGIDAFMKNEVLTYAPDAYVDESKTQIGYEISFTKYFYKPVELREMGEILQEIKTLKNKSNGLMGEVENEITAVYCNNDGTEDKQQWKTKRMREVFSFRKGLTITKSDLQESGIPVISYGQVHSKKNSGVTLDDDLLRHVSETYLDTNPSAIVEQGDFIFADTSEDISGCGNCVYVDREETIFAGYHSIIAHFKDEDYKKYLAYLFQSAAWRTQIHRKVNGVKVYSITQKMLKDAFISLPSYSKQEKIVRYLDNACQKIDEIIAEEENKINNLRELKTKIISDAVTGKIDVRGVKIPEYEFVGEEAAAGVEPEESDIEDGEEE